MDIYVPRLSFRESACIGHFCQSLSALISFSETATVGSEEGANREADPGLEPYLCGARPGDIGPSYLLLPQHNPGTGQQNV